MQVTFDPAKDLANQEKHGCSLVLAGLVDWDNAIVWDDDRYDYGEERQAALGIIEGRVYFIAFVFRDEILRVISLRKANAREVRKYASA